MQFEIKAFISVTPSKVICVIVAGGGGGLKRQEVCLCQFILLVDIVDRAVQRLFEEQVHNQ